VLARWCVNRTTESFILCADEENREWREWREFLEENANGANEP
jgi:hypothetical protein